MHYDEDCLELCRPNSEAWTIERYKELVSDGTKVDQIATILIRWNKFDS